jgi:hypothetical protein
VISFFLEMDACGSCMKSLRYIALLIVSLLIPILVAVIFNFSAANVVKAESPSVCQGYAGAAVDAFKQVKSLGCNYSGPRWQDNYNAHYNWCLSAPKQWVQNEDIFRANQLGVCRKESVALSCDQYARLANSQYRDSLSSSCGFTGGRWQDNYDEHLRWCLTATPEAQKNESEIRSSLISVCRKDPNAIRCDSYAKQAVQQGQEAASRGCGFGGLRWNASYDNHLNWCMHNSSDAANSEASNREGPLSQCRTNNPLPGGSGNTSPGNKHCAADCGVCTREGLRCTNGSDCQERYPTTSPWLCY